MAKQNRESKVSLLGGQTISKHFQTVLPALKYLTSIIYELKNTQAKFVLNIGKLRDISSEESIIYHIFTYIP